MIRTPVRALNRPHRVFFSRASEFTRAMMVNTHFIHGTTLILIASLSGVAGGVSTTDDDSVTNSAN